MTRKELVKRACAEATQWDEFGQGYAQRPDPTTPSGHTLEVVVCICGYPYPSRREHYCPYDEQPDENEAW